LLYVLYGIFFISCLVLVAVVLLQPGKTDAGALFTSNISSSAFGPRGTASVLSKVTIAAATIFMLSALMISMPAFSGNVSVLESNEAEAPATAPAEEPAASNSSADANSANTNASTGALIETPATQAASEAGNSAPAANK
jgi:preprotein translocase subunit SecG